MSNRRIYNLYMLNFAFLCSKSVFINSFQWFPVSCTHRWGTAKRRLPLQLSLCFNAAVHQQAHQNFTRCLPNAAMPLLGGQLSGAWHGAISGSLGRLRWWRRLTGFVRLLLPWLAFGFSEDGDEEEEDEDTTWQGTHCGWSGKGRKVMKAGKYLEALLSWN